MMNSDNGQPNIAEPSELTNKSEHALNTLCFTDNIKTYLPNVYYLIQKLVVRTCVQARETQVTCLNAGDTGQWRIIVMLVV